MWSKTNSVPNYFHRKLFFEVMLVWTFFACLLHFETSQLHSSSFPLRQGGGGKRSHSNLTFRAIGILLKMFHRTTPTTLFPFT